MKEYLPVGSVVLLQGHEKKTIIMGIMQRNGANPEKEYDYLGVPFPEGYMGNGSAYLFDHGQITDTIYMGYTNPEWDALMDLVEYAQSGELDEDAAALGLA